MDWEWAKAIILKEAVLNNQQLLQEQDPIPINKKEPIGQSEIQRKQTPQQIQVTHPTPLDSIKDPPLGLGFRRQLLLHQVDPALTLKGPPPHADPHP